MEEKNKRIAVNTVFLYGRMIIVLLISLYTTKVVLDNLGVSDYGIYNVVGGFVSMFAFLNTSMINAIQRFYNIEKGKNSIVGLNQVFSTAVIIQALLAILLFLALECFGTWYINNVLVVPPNRLIATNWIFQFSVFSLVLLVLLIPYSSAIVSYERMDYFAIVSIFDVLVKLIVVILLPYFKNDKLIIYGLLMFLLSFVNFFLYYIYVKRKIPELRFCFRIYKQHFKSMLSFSGWNVFESIAYTIQGQGLNVLINSFFGTVVNASRGVAFQIQSAVYSFSQNIGTAFRPQLTESYAKEDFGRTDFLFYSMTKVCFFMQFILSVPIILEINSILKLWLGKNIPEYTVSFTILVLINTIIGSINLPMSQVVQATGKIKTYQITRSVIIFLTLPLSYMFLIIYPLPEMVFYATIIVTIINQPLSFYLLTKVYSVNVMLYCKNVVARIIIFSLLHLITTYFITTVIPESYYRILLTLVVDVVSSLILGYIFLLSNEERTMVIRLVNSRIGKR